MELLPLLDFRALATAPAKWFSGFSDLSTLHLPLTTIAGWATLHGPNLMQLGPTDLDVVTSAIWDILTLPPGARFSQSASLRHKSINEKSQAGSSFEERITWKLLNSHKSELKLTGRLIGGCLDTIARLAGTEFGAVPQFVQQSGAVGTLLYLENAEMNPCDVARSLLGLRFNGWFEGLSGILIGRNAGPDRAQSDDLSYVGALQSALGEVGCPVIYDMDIGHVPPQLSLVNGALAQVELCDEHGTVVQWLGGDSKEHTLARMSATGDRF